MLTAVAMSNLTGPVVLGIALKNLSACAARHGAFGH